MNNPNQTTASAQGKRPDSKIHLMALVPNPSYEETYYALDMSAELRNALIDLLKPSDSQRRLTTKELKTQLLHFLDQPVSTAPIDCIRDTPLKNWIVAHIPINLIRLSTIISNWIWSSCKQDMRNGVEHRRVLELTTPAALQRHLHPITIRPFDEQHRPQDPIAFSGFSLSVCDALVGKPCYLSGGTELVFERMQGGTDKAYELISQILWHKDHPYAVGLELSVQTVPPHREARLHVNLLVHRYIHDTWRYPRLNKGINALVRQPGEPWYRVQYAYDKSAKRIAWNELDAQHLRDFAGIELPDLDRYFAHMAAWAQDGHNPQILSPQSTLTTWATTHRVEAGLSFNDKAEIFEFVAACLEGIATPCEPLGKEQFKNFRKAYDERDIDEGELEHETWQLANRHRLGAATQSSRIAFEFIGTAADADDLARAQTEVEAFLGPEGEADGIGISMTTRIENKLLDALEKDSDARAKMRMREIARALPLPPDDTPTACIVILPNADKYEGKNSKGSDPKQAIRMGLAQSGRLSQFLVPHRCDPDAENTFDYRVRTAVRDLMRQLGFMFDFKERKELKTSAPLYGIHLHRTPDTCVRAHYLVATRLVISTGETAALCPQIDPGWMPYWKAQIELGRATSTSERYPPKRCNGIDLKALIDRIATEAPEDSLLLVESYADIRHDTWWPGISDTSLAKGPLRYGPTAIQSNEVKRRIADTLYETERSSLHILRVRLGAHGEVPDYYTDPKPADAQTSPSNLKRASIQGIFEVDGYLLALAPSTGDSPYLAARLDSKFINPGNRYMTKTLNEYYLLTSDDKHLALACVRRAEASRSGLVQLLKSDMRVNRPAPLHLAAQMKEYIWAPRSNGKSWHKK